MSALLLRGGRVIDPASGRDEVTDVLISDGTISDIGAPHDAEEVDVAGCIVAPSLVDMHTHVREPGREDEENIASVSAAAAAGGYGAICAMPNTDPIADNTAVVEKVWTIGQRVGLVDVIPSGALTRGQRGEAMSDLGEMVHSAARVRLFTDDGHGVQNSLLARRAMEYLAAFDAIYAEHCEDEALAADGQMNEGEYSAALGLRGIPAEAEELMAARDIALAKLTGCRLHLLHVSTRGTVELVRRAKAEGVRVTAEATPHHFTLTDAALTDYDPHLKVNPPLRSETDRRAVIEGLVDGTIDAIATDHAPHSIEEKDIEFQFASPGMIGLETALALTFTELVGKGSLSPSQVIERLSTTPARILRLDDHGGPLVAGRPANVVVFDPEAEWTVDPLRLQSKSRNTPFGDRTLKGVVRYVFFHGLPVVRDGAIASGVGV